jgi:hypothetical protein
MPEDFRPECSVAGEGFVARVRAEMYRPCRRTRLSDSVGTCPAEGIPIVPDCAFRPSRTVGALLPSLLRERVVIRVDVLRPMERRPMKTKVTLSSVSFVGLGGVARAIAARAVAEGNAVELTAATRPRLRVLPPRPAAGPRPGHSALPRPATWSSLPCRTGHARCARAASAQVSSSLPPYKSNEGCTT